MFLLHEKIIFRKDERILFVIYSNWWLCEVGQETLVHSVVATTHAILYMHDFFSMSK